uniref:Uncharacterized protein n=1 Tax=Nelumbo nucifera TaxID=4432 RepID=A0A822XKQ3_NELNU|nr:TPA_asm: hypothetical protein HUJ06_021184 [Nelumbo nucifera]
MNKWLQSSSSPDQRFFRRTPVKGSSPDQSTHFRGNCWVPNFPSWNF